VKAPRLRVVHRWLIRSFAVFSLGFGAFALLRAKDGGGPPAIACGVGFVLVALGCVVYLRKSRYLNA
jgi:hypothetical protein